jgi:low affinity Fe/Cu permease
VSHHSPAEPPTRTGTTVAPGPNRTAKWAARLGVGWDDPTVAQSGGVGRRWSRSPASRILHGLDWLAARPLFAATVVALDALWVAFSAVFGFPGRLESVFQTLVAATTLAMVFVIQHTQSREQAATQRKLDEILRALPATDKTMITLESASDEALDSAARVHRRARADSTSNPDEGPRQRHSD